MSDENANERTLTTEDRKKIQRLLESGTQENQNLAFSLIEQTAGQEDIAEIFTMNVILELICLNGPESLEAMVRAGNLILKKFPETWKVFSEAVDDPSLLTSQRYQALLSNIDFVNSRYPSKYLGMHDVSLYEFTGISLAVADQLVDAVNDRLKLGGLTFLSDVVAKSLGQFRGELRLDGLAELTDAAAESLSQHQGKLSLQGLQRLTEAATESLSKHPGELKTNAKITAHIKKYVSSERKKARKSSQTGQRVLTKQQTTKIRKLLRGKTSDQAMMAVQLLETSGATVDDGSDVFSTSIVSLLVNTWDVDVWNTLAPLLLEHQVQRQEFTELVRQRFLKKPRDSRASVAMSLFNRATMPLVPLIKECRILGELPTEGWPNSHHGLTELSGAGAQLFAMAGDTLFSLDRLTELTDVAAESLSNHKDGLELNGLTSLSDAAAESLSNHKDRLELNGLTSLSDAAAESLSKLEDYLWLYGLTQLSDAAARSLSTHAELRLYLDNLPDSAAQILRDAGHG